MATRIKICAGPGCKAWNSLTMANRLIKMEETREVCLVPCMNKCGGGASVRLKDRGRIIKLKETKKIENIVHSIKSLN